MTDHAQRATELAGDCKTTDPRSVQWIMKELEDAYATGRLEGLEEAAKVAETLGVHPALNVWDGGPEWYKHGKEIAAEIRTQLEAHRKEGA